MKFIDIVKRELAMHGRNRRRISHQKVELLETYDFQPLFRTFANGSLTTTDTGLGTSACPHIPIYRYKPSVDLLASTIFPATIAAAPGLEVRPVPHPADFSLFFLRRFLRSLHKPENGLRVPDINEDPSHIVVATLNLLSRSGAMPSDVVR